MKLRTTKTRGADRVLEDYVDQSPVDISLRRKRRTALLILAALLVVIIAVTIVRRLFTDQPGVLWAIIFRWLPAKGRAKKPGAALQRLIAQHPHWSRRRLSIALCETWRTASGQLKDMSARAAVEQASPARVHQAAAAGAQWRTSDSACTLRARTLFCG